MAVRERIRTVFRLFLLFTVLASIALISFLTTVRFTIRGRQATAPKFVGMPLDKAQRTAAVLGLNLKVEDKVYSPQFGANEIVSQMPPPGMRVKVGQHVHVLVSLGRPEITVPNVLGSSVRAARITTIQRGLTVGDVATIHRQGPDADQVVAQDPPPATAEVRSPTVNLLVSLGGPPSALLCPSFIGQPVAEVRGTLERAGFKVGQVTSIAGHSNVAGSVILQSPPPGAKIGPGTTFNFQVAQ